MTALINVVLPVFFVIGFGYIAVWRNYFSDTAVDGLMKFAQNFAIPCLLFQAISTLKLGPAFSFPLLGSFYAAAFLCFLAGLFGTRVLFGRDWADCVAIGFCTMFSNSVLLGLPITERAFGPDALEANYAIIAIHAPFCYIIGITVMELVKNGAGAKVDLARKVTRAVFKNAIILALILGFAVNLSGLAIPLVLDDGIGLVARAALPAALFGLGGILYRYRPEGDMRVIAFAIAVSLVLHPALVWAFGTMSNLPADAFRSALLTSAMAPGVNAYIFANMYGAARRVIASTVLIGTAVAIITSWGWLTVLS